MRTLTPPGMPPYCVNLKVGAVYMLLKNMNVQIGLCIGARFHILQINQYTLLCQLIPAGPHQSADEPLIFLLPCITTTPPELYPVSFSRHQFPCHPAFATTINKSQGSTYDVVGIDLSSPVFSHGKLYVALSRVKDWHSVHILLPTGQPCTTNIVWHTIFDTDYIDRRLRESYAPPPFTAQDVDPDDLEYEDDPVTLHPCAYPETELDDPSFLPEDSFLGQFMPSYPYEQEYDEELPADHWDHDDI